MPAKLRKSDFLPVLLFGVCVLQLLTVAVRRYRVALPLICIIALVVWVVIYHRKRRDVRRGWRLRCLGRDEFQYQEFIDGKWMSITITAELLSGKPQRIFYVPTEEKWKQFPEWVRDRRAEVIARMKTQYPEPHYSYANT